MASDLLLAVALILIAAVTFAIYPPARAPLRRAHADLPLITGPGVDLYRLTVPEGSPLVRRRVGDVVTHPAVSVALIRRGGHSFVPTHDTEIASGDLLLVVAGHGGKREALQLASIAAAPGGQQPP